MLFNQYVRCKYRNNLRKNPAFREKKSGIFAANSYCSGNIKYPTSHFVNISGTKAAADAIRLNALNSRIEGCPGKQAQKSEAALRIRVAEQQDAKLIASWISNDEIVFLGGSDSDAASTTDQVGQWIASALDSYVLLLNGNPIAFMALESNHDGPTPSQLKIEADDFIQIEFGRVIVEREHRRNGYASTLFMHIHHAYIAYTKKRPRQKIIFVARTHRDNGKSIDFFKRLPVKIIRSQPDINYLWYVSPGFPSEIGRFISSRRHALKWTQQKLAYFSGIEPSTLAMIELGGRKLRLEDARSLLAVLSQKSEDELSFASRLLDLDDSIWTTSGELSHELHKTDQTLWIISDVLAENTLPGAMQKTINSVINGCDRVYCVPSTYPSDAISSICRQFVAGIREANANIGLLERHVRFYRAPKLLCTLRLAVHNPKTDNYEAERISVETGRGEDSRDDIGRRGSPLTRRFLEELRLCMLAADDHPSETYNGFQRCEIQWRDINV